MSTIGAVVISRNDNYGGDLVRKFTYTLSSLVSVFDDVYYVDWNSPEDKSLFDEVKGSIEKTGKLHVIRISQAQAKQLANNNPDVQNCCEVLARNIGIRRLNTDYIVSTNSDIMCVSKNNILSGVVDNRTFHTIARTDVDFSEVTDTNLMPGSPELFDYMEKNRTMWGQNGDGSPLGERDRWSLITCPGDFQLAHRDVWYGIKGFDENLVYRGYTDSNVQRKADFYGFGQSLVRSVMAFHFRHYPGSGSTGGNTAGWNNEDEALFQYTGTRNTDSWGFSDVDFEGEVW